TSGQLMMDADGAWVSMQQGVRYRPSGCEGTDCIKTVEDEPSITIDQLVVQFHLLPDLTWSDGAPLTAQDSVYSFRTAQALYGNAWDLLRYTDSYAALDDLTVAWVGIPGYQGVYAENFFSPLPEHLWGLFATQELLGSEAVNRAPLGWGPYIIDQWVAGDHISLIKNPNYFRAGEGLPYFDNLVYRYLTEESDAIDALIVGECDLLDSTILTTDSVPRLREAQNKGQLIFEAAASSVLEQAVFAVDSLNLNRLDLFESQLVRQAVASCIDRQAIVDDLLYGLYPVPDSYLPPEHPLYNDDLPQYPFSPETAIDLLNQAGWVDYDLNPETPRTSVNVPNVPNDTALTFTYAAPDDAERPAAAKIIQESLAQCGIKVELEIQPWNDLLAAGPEGAVFGRDFDMVQFAWAESSTPPCFLYQSDEIPGPYPQYPKGWGGGNLSGYSNPTYDEACREVNTSFPDADSYKGSHARVQTMLAEELPMIPLYWRLSLSAARPDICTGTWTQNLNALESLNYGIDCSDILP
ncbi:MAG: ABC transporter substrate-binding protein, partial [Chloroflexota bacterium]